MVQNTVQKEHLYFASMDVTKLAEKYGTPLFIYDVEKIRSNARAFVDAFQKENVKYQVAYASKAFSSIAMLQVAKQEGLSLDVVSQGELYTALQADFPTDRIHLHGNNKNIEEIEMAVEHDVGCIVLDNFHEIELLEYVLKKQGKEMNVLLRVTPGIEAHTHDYILTGQEDSKFGFDLANGQADKALAQLLNHDQIHVVGLHCHIGSQIFETDGFIMAVQKLFDVIDHWNTEYNYSPSVLNLGGGFGIRYTDDDEPKPLAAYVEALVAEVKKQTNARKLNMPEIWIEPGRAIVGDTAITVYKVGSIKEIPGVRTYVAVDGGMTDNIRPALYNAKYEAVVANRFNEPKSKTVSIAGKCCESGDMLIWDLQVPESIQSGDLLAVYSTGAYSYSMASHYNRFPKAAVVFVENGKDQLVIQRENFADLVKNDLRYDSL
ncbi:diaminopimelate decarboxylase [Salirhabdus salicampi]|uniref:diaminopimelate decarboxylase n=1 Tax=Salirhabdus salicampi TaxID=476102 RepID=UPI0020C51650|nr:diaminopimelate decarboxylase [Salirhabdus salicampi]MCP8616756.1 diaminopimelate decarboxylase [Salirhabdus salicampi]